MMISLHQPSVYFQEDDNLTLVAKIENDEKISANAAVVNKAIYLRTAKHLYKIEEK